MSLVLITGGAGFIGSHVADFLIREGCQVRVLDNLSYPTHRTKNPENISSETQFVLGDVCDQKILSEALSDVEYVIHLAAIGGFTSEWSSILKNNILGTSCLIETLMSISHKVKKIIVASSIAVYREGRYRCVRHGEIDPPPRVKKNLEKGFWNHFCNICGDKLNFSLTPEESAVDPPTAYGISKYAQEKLIMRFGEVSGIPSVGLRFFVTYGPKQSIYNPYTGVISIFSTRILNDLPPVIFEDGFQCRDFVYVEDVAQACRIVLENSQADGEIFNVGTGKAVSIKELADMLIDAYKKKPILIPEISGKFRLGEFRNMTADISKLSRLGYVPKYSLEKGIGKYLDWIKTKENVKDYFTLAQKELCQAGVILHVQQ
jgi:dTDP-L-rhamnose 4-epimerase